MERNYGKEIIKEILEKEPKIWGYLEIVNYIADLTGKSKRTIKRWLTYYREYGEKEGIIYRSEKEGSGRVRSWLYAKKFQGIIEEEISRYKQEIKEEITELQNEIRRKYIDLQESFEYWLRYEIKRKLYSLKKRTSSRLLDYEVGESKRLAAYRKKLKDMKEIEKAIEEKLRNGEISIEWISSSSGGNIRIINYENGKREHELENRLYIYEIYKGLLSYEDEILFLDAILTHSNIEIQKIAWKWFVEYKEEIEECKK